MREIRGLSLTRPWPFAFANATAKAPAKRLENRSRSLGFVVDIYVALHAAKSWNEYDREFIADTMGIIVPRKHNSPHSEIFAVCRVAGVFPPDKAGDIPSEQRVWYFGPHATLFDEYVQLVRPVSCVGALGLWKFDDKPEVLQALRESYRESIQRKAA